MEDYSILVNEFKKEYKYQYIKIGKANFKYLLVGSGKTICLLNGGMNISGMWMDYIKELSKDYQVLSFDYPLELTTNVELISGMHELFKTLGITNPVLVGASYGGYVLEMYARSYKEEVSGLILLSTGGLDQKTINSYRLKKMIMPLVIWYMKHSNYDKFKKKMIKFGVSQAKNETEELREYAKQIFTELFRDYTLEKDLHITGLLLDLFNQVPVSKEDFSLLTGKILLILPTKDFFSKKDQEILQDLMHHPKISYVNGSHVSTLLQSDKYLMVIKEFLGELN